MALVPPLEAQFEPWRETVLGDSTQYEAVVTADSAWFLFPPVSQDLFDEWDRLLTWSRHNHRGSPVRWVVLVGRVPRLIATDTIYQLDQRLAGDYVHWRTYAHWRAYLPEGTRPGVASLMSESKVWVSLIKEHAAVGVHYLTAEGSVDTGGRVRYMVRGADQVARLLPQRPERVRFILSYPGRGGFANFMVPVEYR